MISKPFCLIGYSGHSLVAADIIVTMGRKVEAYCDTSEKEFNPINITYLGNEQDKEVLENLKSFDYFVSIGNNSIRKLIYERIKITLGQGITIVHSTAVISPSAKIGEACMISCQAIINAFSKIEDGVICNSGSIIEHESKIGAFSHIAPGAVLAGNVKIGHNTFIGANAVIKEGIEIGNNCLVGAGTVVVKNIPDNQTVVGNPQRKLH